MEKDKTAILISYLGQFEKLKKIINTSNQRLLSEEPDNLIEENINFFTKSFLVLMCTYLESYLKDVLMLVVENVNSRLSTSEVPNNLINWSINKNKQFKPGDYKYTPFKLEIERKDIDDFISGNPFKTRDLIKKFGIPIHEDSKFNSQLDLINAIIVKRNKIIHHNDNTSDVSNSDLLNYIDNIQGYITNIDELIKGELK